jgi:hypothetical protein
VSQDPFDHRLLEDGRDDLQLPGAAVRAVLHVDVEGQLCGVQSHDLYVRCGSKRLVGERQLAGIESSTPAFRR